MIMEYYTKSEGLGFLIRKSRIDFRIEFRGVSILFEFNPLIWLVSHDHHQTVRYGEVAGVSIAESTFSNSSGHKWPHDGATENLALRQGDDSNNTTVNLQRWKSRKSGKARRSDQMSKGEFKLSQVEEIRRKLQVSCILPSWKLSIQKSIDQWSYVTLDD